MYKYVWMDFNFVRTLIKYDMVKLFEDSQVIICALLQHEFERMKSLKGQNYIEFICGFFLDDIKKDNPRHQT